MYNSVTTYRGKHIPRRRSAANNHSNGPERTDKTAARLIISLCILGAAIGFRLFFPAEAETASGKVISVICADADFKGAVQAIANAFDGSTPVTEALGQAWISAFGFSTDQSIPLPSPSTSFPTPSLPTDTISSPEITLTPAPTEAVEPTTTYLEDAMAAFTEKQSAYAHLGVPAGVTFDAPKLNVSGSIPVNGTVTSSFGYRTHPVYGDVRFHYGIDIGADEGANITVFAAGTVKAVGESSSLGLYLLIDHGDGLITEYAHCSEVFVSSGDSVEAGETIAAVGSTGNATGNCLHFEIMLNGVNINPEFYLIFA